MADAGSRPRILCTGNHRSRRETAEARRALLRRIPSPRTRTRSPVAVPAIGERPGPRYVGKLATRAMSWPEAPDPPARADLPSAKRAVRTAVPPCSLLTCHGLPLARDQGPRRRRRWRHPASPNRIISRTRSRRVAQGAPRSRQTTPAGATTTTARYRRSIPPMTARHAARSAIDRGEMTETEPPAPGPRAPPARLSRPRWPWLSP